MASNSGSKNASKRVETLLHEDVSRTNIPSAEHQAVVGDDIAAAVAVAYERRNRDLDPQIVWRGKDEQNLSDLIVNAPPLYIQEYVHPKVIIDDLTRNSEQRSTKSEDQLGLFADFGAVGMEGEATEFYQHESSWANRMILGDSLQVMSSLSERESLRGKVQCIYFDPPYGISFNSNFQWSTTTKAVTDGKLEHITREPEQVKAFRDTWRDGIHSYLSYIRDRLLVARDLLTDSGSIFVQIGHENVHRVRMLLDEVFGAESLVCEIVVKKKGAQKGAYIDPVNDFILWYGKSTRESRNIKCNTLYEERPLDYEAVDYFSRIELPDGSIHNLKDKSFTTIDYRLQPELLGEHFPGGRLLRQWPITNGGFRENQMAPVRFNGKDFSPPKGRCWSHTSKPKADCLTGMDRVRAAGRLMASGVSLDFKRYYDDFPFKNIANWWDGFRGALDQVYVVQTNERIVERCILMASDPGDLVMDPTCGSGTTAAVAEKWGRRWITIDTSRVALALSRARLMSAKYPFYLLADSEEGSKKVAEVYGRHITTTDFRSDIRQGFVNRSCAYRTSGLYANNADIDIIVSSHAQQIAGHLERLNSCLEVTWSEYDVPSEPDRAWSSSAKDAHKRLIEALFKRRQEIEKSTSAKAENVVIFDKPYEDKSKVRVAGPFTVESATPHRVLSVDEHDELVDTGAASDCSAIENLVFTQVILENLKTSGVQQAHKEGRINFTSLDPWPGEGLVCARGTYLEEDVEKRVGIFVGPEFGTVQRSDLVAAARECADAGFDALIACAFNYDAHSSDFNKLGRIPVLKARMNADLHMADDLKNTGKGNLFVIFGEPDIDILNVDDGKFQVKVNGVDVFHPQTGEVRSDGPDGIACWFIDTDYNEEAFFVRHAYFLGANDPYKSLKTTLKAEIDEEAWASLNSDTSRPFTRPSSGRIAVKVINHLGDEVMKVFRVD